MFGSLLENVGMNNGGGKKKMSTTNWLAERHGITKTTSMYVPYLLLLMCWTILGVEYSLICVPLQVLHLLYTLFGLDTAV